MVKRRYPLVGTGVEEIVARQSNWCIFAKDDGEVLYVDANRVVVNYKKREKEYKITKHIELIILHSLRSLLCR